MSTNQKTTGSAILPKPSPSKKFSLATKIRNQIRTSLRKEAVWTHNTPQSLIKRFDYDIKNRVVPVKGTKYANFDYNLVDVVSLLNELEFDIHQSFRAKKLRDSPMFSYVHDSSESEEFEGCLVIANNQQTFLDQYDNFHNKFLQRQRHTLEGAFCYDTWSTYVLCLEMSLDYIKDHSLSTLTNYLYKKLLDMRYSRIDPFGLYAFILHLKVRGATRAEHLVSLAKWKNAWSLRNPQERQFILNSFYKGIMSSQVQAFIHSYIFEVNMKNTLLRNETKLVRYNYVPNQFQLNPEYVYYASWYNGVYLQMTDVERYRDKTGLNIYVNNSSWPEIPCNCENMTRSIWHEILKGNIEFSCPRHAPEFYKNNPVGEFTGLTDGLVDPAIEKAKVAMQDVIDKSIPKIEERINSMATENIEKTKLVLNESVQKTLSDPTTIELIKASTSEALKPVIDDISSKVTNLTDKTIDDLKATVAPVLNESMGTFSSLNGILDFLKGTMKSVTDMIPIDLLGRIGIKIDMDVIISIFKYYIIYINVESSFIKTALFVLMLKELGLFEMLQKYGTIALSWIKESSLPDVEIPTDALVAEPTGVLDWMNTLMNMINGHVSEITICTFISLILTIVYKVSTSPPRTALNFKDHKNVSSYVIEAFKNAHFIGAGCYGVERIIKYAKTIGDVVSKWVSYYIFGQKADERAVEKKIARWYGQLCFFVTEGGRSTIRINEKALQLAERIQPEGLAFIQMHSADPDSITKEAIQLVLRSQKNAADIASFCFRIRSMSNFQPAMFHVQFVGPPGIGKSTLTENLISKIAAEIYPKDRKITHYSYNPNMDHFDGYNQQLFMIIDDLFRFNEPKHLSLLIGLVTNTPVMLPMAHLDEKGMQLQSDFLISSTNTPYPEGKDVFCMEAVHRRRHVLVEVVPDQRVMDKANSQFSKELFDRYYPGKNPKEFPHLTFNLLKPTIKPDENNIKTTTGNEMRYYEKVLERMREVNDTLTFSPNEYFGEDAAPQLGYTVPCKGWSFDLLIKNIVARYASLRTSEQKLSAKEKFVHVMDCFDEINKIHNQEQHIKSNVEFDKKHTLIADKYLDASYAYGIDDPLGKKIYLSEDKITDALPELDQLDKLDKIVDEILAEEAIPTSDTISSAASNYEEASSDLLIPRLEIINEFILRVPPTEGQRERLDQLKLSLKQNPDVDKLPREQHLLYDKVMRWKLREEGHTPEWDPHTDDELDSSDEEEEEIDRRLSKFLKYNVHETPRMSSLIWTDDKGRKHIRMDAAYQEAEEEFSQRMKSITGLPLIDPISFAREQCIEPKLKELEESQAITPQKAQLIRNFLKQGNDGTDVFYYPKRYPYTKAQQGGRTSMPREWLKRLKFFKGDWYMDVSDMHFETTLASTSKEDGKPMDIGYILLSNNTFVLAIAEFCRMTRKQQEDAIKTIRWFYRHLGFLSIDNLKGQLSNIFSTIKEKLLTYVYTPLQHFWNVIVSSQSGKFAILVKSVLTFIAGVFLIRQIGRLFTGKTQPTSKVLHRTPRAGIVYKGKFTGLLDSNNTDAQLAQQYLNRNVRFIKITNQDGITQIAHAIHTNQYLILNKHVTDKIEGIVEIEFPPTPKSPNVWTFQIECNNIYTLPNSDVSIIFSRLMPMGRDIRKHFITDADYEKMDSVGELWSLSRFEEEAAVEIRTSCRPFQDASMVTEDRSETGYISRGMLVEGDTICGKSGSMLVRPNKSPGNRNIIGIQAWKYKEYYRRTIIYQVVTQENLELMLNEVHNQMKQPQILQTGPLIAEPTSSQAEELIESHIEIIGSVPADKRVGMVGKTAFRRTRIAHLMDYDGYQSKRVPAALNPLDPRLIVKEHPMKHSLNKYGRGIVGPFNKRIMEKATHDMAYWLKNQLDKTEFNTHLSLEECVTGTREPGSNPIDCRASPGLPYIWEKFPGKLPGKKNIVQISEDGECLIVDPTYPEKFEKFYSSLQNGVIPRHTSYDFPKDELRPIAKALGDVEKGTPPKTRSVTCMSLDIILSWRRLTLDLFASLHRRARGDFPFGPGINPEGPDWARLYHYLNLHPFALDFDVSNWDGHMPIDLMMAVGDMLVIILNLKPHSPEAKAIYSILTEVIFGFVQFEDLVYHKLRGLISGFPGTAETNTLAHMLLLYYFYLLICEENMQYGLMNISSFMKNVSFICYGDDVQMSISPDLISFYHGKSIAEQYELHGYPVTDAAKGSDIPFYKPLLETQFLKSSFNIISPSRVDRMLDLDVVYDLFYWVRAKEHPYEQFCSNIHDAMRVVHGHGKKVYDNVLNQLNLWLTKANIPTFDIRWENFEEMHIRNYYTE